MEKIKGLKIVRRKPMKKSPAEIRAEQILKKYGKKIPDDPFIKVGEIIEREYKKRKEVPA
jgi:hypothetical protein